MAGYLEEFDKLAAASTGLGGPERALLHLIGLFDRPADGTAVDMLLAERIPGLTDDLFVEPDERRGLLGLGARIALRRLSRHERTSRLREAKSRLRKLRLIANEDRNDRHGLDAHPVVRAYFATRLEETAPEAARAAHERLYRHYAAAAPDLPDTLEQMQPLLHAIGHGVKGGRVREAYEGVFQRRIRRAQHFYTYRVLGAFSADLAALATFFDTPWTEPQSALPVKNQAEILANAAFALKTQGRLKESIVPAEAGLAAMIAQKDWDNAVESRPRAGGYAPYSWRGATRSYCGGTGSGAG